jgi:hypothetical protein
MPVIVRLQLPDRTTTTIDLADKQMLLVRDLKQLLYNQNIVPVQPHLIKLIFRRSALNDGQHLDDVGLGSGDKLDVVVKVTAVSTPIMQMYDDFVESMNPPSGAIDIPVDVVLQLVLKVSNIRHQLYLPALLKFSKLCTLSSGFDSSTFSPFSASTVNTSTTRWSDELFEQRVLLLQLDGPPSKSLEKTRYNLADLRANNNDGRCDLHSWQRYTHHLPIPCEINASDMGEPMPHHITVTPRRHLHHATTYALLLSNHVPTVPLRIQPQCLDFVVDGMGEDKLLVFTTRNDDNKVNDC